MLVQNVRREGLEVRIQLQCPGGHEGAHFQGDAAGQGVGGTLRSRRITLRQALTDPVESDTLGV